ncbi:MAG TPA: carbamate kinase [Bacillota bacterium]
MVDLHQSRNETIVVALGGNAILQPGQAGSAEEQLANVDRTCRQIARMIQAGYRVVVTHGNGPQVGNILIQNAEAAKMVPALPMDMCGAESQGLIGYMMQNRLQAAMADLGLTTPVATIVTQTVVAPSDPAFQKPTKPVGPFYTEAKARKAMAEKGETWIEDAGRGWRRVVPSPDPVRIVEEPAIKTMSEAGMVVICVGGGGIPVIEEGSHYRGVEAVIDKDLGGARLGLNVRADIFMILTDVRKVAINYKTPQQANLDRLTVKELRRYQAEGHFKAGSMGPKVEACRRFVAGGGRRAVIASLDEALEALNGGAGTQIVESTEASLAGST